jgi:hypothetical protein
VQSSSSLTIRRNAGAFFSRYYTCLRFKVLTAVTTKNTVFRCNAVSLGDTYWRFGTRCCFHSPVSWGWMQNVTLYQTARRHIQADSTTVTQIYYSILSRLFVHDRKLLTAHGEGRKQSDSDPSASTKPSLKTKNTDRLRKQ